MIALGLLAVTACSPALNWREARLAGLTALLPCKPDKAQRAVELGTRTLHMALQACEAQSTLFAMSHIALQTPEQAAAVIADWRSATLANMRSTGVQEQPFQIRGLSSLVAPVQLVASGVNATGAPVRARLAWFASGAHVYHLAIYGADVSSGLSEPLFADLRLLP